MKNFSETMREIRLDKNLTILDVEKATGIKNANLSRWERGEVIPGINFCIQLAQFYGCSLDELVGLDNSQEIRPLPTQPHSETAVFATKYADIINDDNFIGISKLYKAITPELRALVLGYSVGLLQSKGINTANILGY